MQTSTFVSLLALATSALAAPTELLPRARAQITMCQAANFNTNGYSCRDFDVDTGVCQSFSDYGSAVYNQLNDQVSSYSASKSCTYYVNTGCTSTSWTGSYNANLATTSYNDKMSSFKC